MADWSIEYFQAEVEDETTSAGSLVLPTGTHLDLALLPRVYFINVAAEELGLLARTANKLLIAPPGDIREQWLTEGYHRIVTTSSVLRRLAERWRELPERPDDLAELGWKRIDVRWRSP